MRHHTVEVALAALLLVLAACGGGSAGESTTTVPHSMTSQVTTTGGSTTPTSAPHSSTSAPTTTSPGSVTTSPVEGEVVDFGPGGGDVLGVVGVAHDDVLHVRSGAGVEHPVMAELEPTADDIEAVGNTRLLDGAYWVEVRASGAGGWVNLRYLAYLGDTSDITARVIEQLGQRPETETMLDMAMVVAGAVSAQATDAEVVISVAPTVGDLGEITLDVLGFEDDSVRGSRLHIFGTPSESGEGFILESVESRSFCARGVEDGVCI